MTYDQLIESLDQSTPPEGDTLLAALWHQRKGHWDEAHRLAQTVETSEGSWVHALLHREEGDRGNASYWYNRAGRSYPDDLSLEAEWDQIARHLCG